MRIAVVGAGALGSLYAGMLARAGTDVTLLGRSPAHIDMIRAEGLRMTVQEKADWTVRLAATVDAHTIGRVDTVIFLTKTPDVQQAAIGARTRSEEHTSELQSLMRISYAVFCLKQ